MICPKCNSAILRDSCRIVDDDKIEYFEVCPNCSYEQMETKSLPVAIENALEKLDEDSLDLDAEAEGFFDCEECGLRARFVITRRYQIYDIEKDKYYDHPADAMEQELMTDYLCKHCFTMAGFVEEIDEEEAKENKDKWNYEIKEGKEE